MVDQLFGTAHGFVVSIDAFGEAQVMPLGPALAEIKGILNSKRVWLPGLKTFDLLRSQTINPSSLSSAEPRIADHTLRHGGKPGYIDWIESLESLCRHLYKLLKLSEQEKSYTERSGIATSFRQLHTALQHLRAELGDPDSPLRKPSSSTFRDRQLSDLLDRRLPEILDTCSYILVDESIWGPSEASHHIAAVMQEMIIKMKDVNMDIDRLLDSVQLHGDERPATANVAKSSLGIEHIKDKVDAIATRVFAWKDSGVYEESEDANWSAFKYELEKEGFSPQVLRRHQV